MKSGGAAGLASGGLDGASDGAVLGMWYKYRRKIPYNINDKRIYYSISTLGGNRGQQLGQDIANRT